VPSRDRSLQTIRRVDWRFLLPEAQLDRVVYLGPGEDRLLTTLQECARFVAVAPSAGDAREAGLREKSFDVAVLQSPDRRALAAAAALLRRGGWLYCELARPALWDRSLLTRRRRASDGDRVRGPAHARSVLGASGFRDVEAHWQYPDFERCGWIVPLGRASAGALFLTRVAPRLFPPPVAGVAGRVLRARLVAGLLPCVSVIARKGGDE
jgi:hypothetical protein